MTRSSRAEGRMDKILCSKAKVKSNSLVQLAGPNALSEQSAISRSVETEVLISYFMERRSTWTARKEWKVDRAE